MEPISRRKLLYSGSAVAAAAVVGGTGIATLSQLSSLKKEFDELEETSLNQVNLLDEEVKKIRADLDITQAALEKKTIPVKPWVLVTPEGPDDGGDFGRNTPGTRTSGIKEALDFAHENERDVYIVGGMGGFGLSRNIYWISETLKVPWMQDFRLDGGEYLIVYTPKTGDAVHIDSQMNCRFKFGMIVCDSTGAAVDIRPENPGPDSNIGVGPIMSPNTFEFNCVCSRGTGIKVDSSRGPVYGNRIFAVETNTRDKGVHIVESGAGGGTIHNRIQVLNGNQYEQYELPCTGLRIGDPGSDRTRGNRVDMFLGNRGVEGSIGADIFGQSNILTLSFDSTNPSGKNIVFEPEAKDNLVFAISLQTGIENRARTATNRVVSLSPVGFGISTPALPASGEDIANMNPYPVQVIILTPGTVSGWTIVDAEGKAQTVSAGLIAGQTIILDPGEKISFTYAVAPTWRWKGLG